MSASSEHTDIESGVPGFHTDLPVGEILRRTRVHYNLDLEDVANYLRIRASQLEALEVNDIEQLPGRVYAIGYVRTYSEYLGLDGEKMIELFKQQATGRVAQKPEHHFPVSASESKAPNVVVIFGSLVLLVLVLGGWIVFSAAGSKTEPTVAAEEIPSLPPELQAAAQANGQTSVPVTATPPSTVTPSPAPVAATATPADPAAPATAAPPVDATAQAAAPVAATPQGRQIIMNVKDRSWVEVRDLQGKVILSRILKPGEVFIVPEENYGLRLDTGNAGGLELVVNGQVIPPLGRSGDILRGYVLDGNKIIQGMTAAPAVAPTPATAPAPATTLAPTETVTPQQQ